MFFLVVKFSGAQESLLSYRTWKKLMFYSSIASQSSSLPFISQVYYSLHASVKRIVNQARQRHSFTFCEVARTVTRRITPSISSFKKLYKCMLRGHLSGQQALGFTFGKAKETTGTPI